MDGSLFIVEEMLEIEKTLDQTFYQNFEFICL
jgi:hypothetical protein